MPLQMYQDVSCIQFLRVIFLQSVIMATFAHGMTVMTTHTAVDELVD